MILDLFFPHGYARSVFDIDYRELYRLGYRAVVFDIDNTLVLHGADSNEAVDNLFRSIQAIGLKTFLLSNNGQERICRFCANIDTPFLANAGKPDPRSYRKVLRMLDVPREQAVFIGDQIFTDILGANLSGIPGILVRYLRRPGEGNPGKRRAAEGYILSFYTKRKSRRKALASAILISGDD